MKRFEGKVALVTGGSVGLDVVFNNAGVEGKLGPIGTLSVADFDETFGINVRGSWLVMKHALPHLETTKGAIINNSSVAADLGMAGTTIYAASKGAITTLTRTAAIRSRRDSQRFREPLVAAVQ